jgi:cardiolipin synthase
MHASNPAPAHSPFASLRLLAGQALSRAAGAPLVGGNRVELLIDGEAHFRAWAELIESARHYVLLENYIIADDAVGRRFRDLLVARAHAGVAVALIHDWFGTFGNASRSFFAPLRAAGVAVRAFNRPRVESPLGWVGRDHRKLLVVDGQIGSISGVCLAAKWLGDSAHGIAPWRDSGLLIGGPAVADIEAAFRDSWAGLGAPLEFAAAPLPAPSGEVALRVIATQPAHGAMYRLDALIAAMATRSLWISDAYFVGIPTYVRGLAAAAEDGVDVRLLVPGNNNLPAVGALSRAGYRPLLEAGIRVFEWNGSMMHAKTAVADGRWARVGSSNLNLSSWLANCEIDAAVEDAGFAERMQEQFLRDLDSATELTLRGRRPQLRAAQGRQLRSGSSSRAAASALRLANTVGAAIANRRVLGDSERGVLTFSGGALVALAVLGFWLPELLAWPLAAFCGWLGLSLLWRRIKRVRARRKALAERL